MHNKKSPETANFKRRKKSAALMKSSHSNRRLNWSSVFKKRWSQSDYFNRKSAIKRETTSRRCSLKTRSTRRRPKRSVYVIANLISPLKRNTPRFWRSKSKIVSANSLLERSELKTS